RARGAPPRSRLGLVNERQHDEGTMGRTTILALGILGVLSVPQAGADDAKPEAAVRGVLADQAVAWNKGDLEGFMAGYWKSADLSLFSGKDRSHGWQATLERYVKKYRADGKEMGKLTFSEQEVNVLGPDAALVR